nr:zf-CCHC domain-containing protein/DUF4219 domain-containing protein/UBN2 domain-containing protein [Tanacetum cinerariifolium]
MDSQEEATSLDSDDEEYTMAVRDFKKFFRRRGKFVRQPYDDKKNFRKVKEDKKEKDDQRCFKCDDPNHFISDCPKYSFNDQKAVQKIHTKMDSQEEATSLDSDDEEYTMAVRDFKKFFRRRGKFVRQPYDDKKNFRKVKEDKKEKDDQRYFKCDDPNHFISDCPKYSFNDQKAFVVRC